MKLPVVIIAGKSPYTSTGGYASYARNIAKIITATGHPVHLLTFGDRRKIEKRDIAKVHFIQSRWLNHLPLIRNIELVALPFYSFFFLRELLTISKSYGNRKIIVWGVGPWALAGAILKIMYGRSVVLLSSHFTTFRHEMRGSLDAIQVEDYGITAKLKYLFVYHVISRIYSFLSSLVVRESKKIITHYKSTEEILNDEFHPSREKFFRMKYFVEVFAKEIKVPISKRMQKALASKKPIVTSICRQDPRKGINYLLHAMALVKSEVDCECLIVGAGIMRDANKYLAKKLGLSWVVFPGVVSDIHNVLRHSSVYVLPTVEEGSSALSIIEAMSQGTPIVTTRSDGIPEDITDGYSGLLVPTHNAPLLARAIVRVLKDKSLAKNLAANARRMYEKKFAFSAMKEDVEKLLESL